MAHDGVTGLLQSAVESLFDWYANIGPCACAPVRTVTDDKAMVAIMWSSTGFHILDFTPGAQTMNSPHFILNIFGRLVESLILEGIGVRGEEFGFTDMTHASTRPLSSPVKGTISDSNGCFTQNIRPIYLPQTSSLSGI
jgi:hypothetical protein